MLQQRNGSKKSLLLTMYSATLGRGLSMTRYASKPRPEGFAEAKDSPAGVLAIRVLVTGVLRAEIYPTSSAVCLETVVHPAAVVAAQDAVAMQRCAAQTLRQLCMLIF
jgi:hypothetical protein